MIEAYQGWRFNADASQELIDVMVKIYPNDDYRVFDWLIVADTKEKAFKTAREYSSINTIEWREFEGKFYVLLMPVAVPSDSEMDEFLELLK